MTEHYKHEDMNDARNVAEMRSAQQRLEKTAPQATDVDAILAERGSRYGVFAEHAKIAQRLKDNMRHTPNWDKLDNDQAEALEMIAHKIGRILNGDPNYDDSWADIAGYSKLVADRLKGISK